MSADRPGRVRTSAGISAGQKESGPVMAGGRGVGPERKFEAVLATLSGRNSVSEAARLAGVGKSVVRRWQREFIEAGQASMHTVGPLLASGEAALQTENDRLRAELENCDADIRRLRGTARATLGPSRASRPSVKVPGCRSRGSVRYSASRAERTSAASAVSGRASR